MKKSEFKSYIREEIISILSEESASDIEAKAKAQSELNKELEKTKELSSDIMKEEDEMDDDAMDKQASAAAGKGDSVSKIANKLGETTREMKSVVKKWKAAEEPEKSRLLARLKELTKIKNELEALL